LPGEVKEKKEASSTRDKILAGAKQYPDGNTKTAIAVAGKLKLSSRVSLEFEALVKDKKLVTTQIKKGNVSYPGFALAS